MVDSRLVHLNNFIREELVWSANVRGYVFPLFTFFFLAHRKRKYSQSSEGQPAIFDFIQQQLGLVL